MKHIEIIIRPGKLDAVKEALAEVTAIGMTVTEVKGFGRQKGHKEVYRGAEYNVEFQPKLLVEVVAPDDRAQAIAEAAVKAASTGEIGDGKVFVSQIDDAIRIRTGESGDASLE